jgi:hypothetical protein
MVHRIFLICIVISLIGLVQSCRPTRYIEKGDYLLTKNVIHINGKDSVYTGISEDALSNVLKQKPNRKLFGLVNFHLGVWNFANGRNPDKRFTKFLKEDVGEAPVTYEPALLTRSAEQLTKYLNNHGHFNADVVTQAWIDSSSVELHYFVNTGNEYKLRKLGKSFEDDSLKSQFVGNKNDALDKLKLRAGSVYNTDELSKERVRLTKALRDLGYCTFEKIHITYDIDTNIAGNYFDVIIRFRNLRNVSNISGVDSVTTAPHLKHQIAGVIVNQNFQVNGLKGSTLDSTYYRNYLYLSLSKPYVRPARIVRNLFLNRGDLYSQSKMKYTYERISGLGTYRFIDIDFEQAGTRQGVPQLDMIVNLNKAPKQGLTFETAGTNRSGNLGISSSVNYTNKNLFSGAEQFNWKVYGGLEWQNTNTSLEGNQNSVIRKTLINTYEYGSEVSLTIPDFLFRLPGRDLPRIKEPKTNISLALDRQGRPQYDRNLINTTFQWTLRLRDQDQLTLAPIDISYVQLEKTKAFTEQLNESRNVLLINSYSDHIISAGRLAYSYTTQDFTNALKNFYYYRLSFESTGNLLRAVSKPLNLQESKGSYLIDTLAFAQYVKADFEYKKYFILTRSSSYVIRLFAGSGLPLANRKALPFDRSFFAGGSNGIRAWRARALGPGNVADTTTYGIDQVGEIQLELNLEYRFKIVKQFEGAAFVDLGNIWFWNDENRTKANFNVSDFWRGVAVAPGAGLRYNLNFFVLRFDAGLQLKDPNLPEGERWAFFQPKSLTNQYRQEWRLNNGDPNLSDWKRPEVTFNLAISYPF